ncbi:lipoprotein [Uliginosibacterium sp. TH139]|nr:hypothetical protein C0V76_02020 [Uliginosibacterium sp. TH139]
MRPMILLAFLSLSLAACGIKGPLEHPPAQRPAPTQFAPA